MRPLRFIPAALLVAFAAQTHAHAQISLGTAVDLGLRNSPKVRMAQADLDKARATLGEAKDAFVPQVSTNEGYGKSTGAPLGVPIIFSISANSLVFSFSQPDYIRAAKASVDATNHALLEAQIEVSEDVSNTYLALDNALRRRDVLSQELEIASRLVEVTHDRVDAGVDAHIELTKSKRTVEQIRLQALLINDEVAEKATHLAQLTGIADGTLKTEHQSIPQFSAPMQAGSNETTDQTADSEGVKAAFAIARARELTAHGDKRYLLRPQIVLEGNYSRVDTGLSSYASYYPRFEGPPGGPPNSNNSLAFGVSITIPLLDMAHRSKARESEADARHALAEANNQRDLFREGRAKLRNATLELDSRAKLAQLDQELSQDQLDALHVQLQANAANLPGTQATPKDELNARLQERQKFYDLLNAQLQLQQTQVNLLRQQGGLADWVHASIGLGITSPTTTAPVVIPETNTPAVPGTPPAPAVPTPTTPPQP